MHSSSLEGESSFMGCFALGYGVSQQAKAFILGRKKDGGRLLVLFQPGEGGCKARSAESWLWMFYQD